MDTVATLETEVWALALAQPHPRNPRKHPKPGSPKWDALKASLKRDYFDPMVVNKRNGLLVSGHLRRAVLLELGITHATVVVVDYDEPTHVARLIAANTLLGEFEETVLGELAKELDGAGLDAALAGMTDKELIALVGAPTTVDDTEETEELLSKAEQLQQKWTVQPGDLYQIGNHRLLCGECESQDNWTLLLEGQLADMVWTDPPYNVAYDSLQRRRNELSAERGRQSRVATNTILNDNLPEKVYAEKLLKWFGAAFANLKAGGAIYVAHADGHGTVTRNAFDTVGFRLAQCLVWVKQGATLGRQDYQWQHEPILYGWKPGAGHYWQGGFSQKTVIDDEKDITKMSKPELQALVNELRNERMSTVVREPRNVSSELHPTVKPVRLVARQLWSSSKRGETVLELFGGSGTTLAAAEQTGRRCTATELDPKYCAVILERMSAYGLTIEKVHPVSHG